MIKYNLKQNKNAKSTAYGKWYAFPVVEETMDLEDLAQHMEEHNSGFSEAMCVGVMKAMVKCIKEQLLAGKNVKIDNLAIFSVGIKNKGGAESEEEFSASANISGVKLRARATGTLSNANLNRGVNVRRANVTLTTSSTKESVKKTLTLSASPVSGGTVTGAGEYEPGTAVEVSASANSGYSFSRWSDGNTDASRTVTVNDDTSLEAIFTSTAPGGGGGDDSNLI